MDASYAHCEHSSLADALIQIVKHPPDVDSWVPSKQASQAMNASGIHAPAIASPGQQNRRTPHGHVQDQIFINGRNTNLQSRNRRRRGTCPRPGRLHLPWWLYSQSPRSGCHPPRPDQLTAASSSNRCNIIIVGAQLFSTQPTHSASSSNTTA